MHAQRWGAPTAPLVLCVHGLSANVRTERFDLIGWSLGALIGITAAGLAADRLRTFTLIDHCGREDAGAYAAVRQGLDRLDAVVDRPEDYVRVYTYELVRAGDRFTRAPTRLPASRSSTHRSAPGCGTGGRRSRCRRCSSEQWSG